MLPSEWVISNGLRGSAMTAANLSATPSRRSACPSNITPASEVTRPPSKAAVIFLTANGWEREREKAIFDHGGCGFDAMAEELV